MQGSEVKKESFIDLLNNLKEMDEQLIDEGVTPDEYREKISEVLEKVNNKADALLDFMDTCKMKSAQYMARAEELRREAKRWEKRLEHLESYTLYALNNFPEADMTGTDRKITKKLNPPSMICPYKQPRTISNYVPPAMALNIDPMYLESQQIWTLKTDELKEDLKAGATFDFARLERKESLSIKVK